MYVAAAAPKTNSERSERTNSERSERTNNERSERTNNERSERTNNDEGAHQRPTSPKQFQNRNVTITSQNNTKCQRIQKINST